MKNVLLLLVLATIAACGGKGGTKGINGVNGAQGIQGIQGEKGEPGTDTFWEQYLLWRQTHPNGNGIGDFMNWLRGQQGEQGIQGIQGEHGSNGKSALEGWIALNCPGFAGTCDSSVTWGNYMSSMHGKDGVNGSNGKSALEGWIGLNCPGFTGTCDSSVTWGNYMSSMHGKDGINGKDGKDGVAYASFFDKVSDFSELSQLSTSTKMKALVKGLTGKHNFVVVQEYDSNSNKTTYSVYDLTNYVIGNVSSAVLVDYNSVDQMGNSGVFKVTLKDGSSSLLTAESDSSKDVEQMGSKIESAKVDEVKGTLLQYGLSAERTEKLSKLLVSYKQIANKRALNATEKDQFTKELLGMSFEKAAKEMVENYEGLMLKAADKNGTSPEAVKELVGQMLSM